MKEGGSRRKGDRVVMRKLITGSIREILDRQDDRGSTSGGRRAWGLLPCSDGKAEFPLRVHDYPPDETTLVGAGVGLAQVGFVPVVELPYAKYLDCGADMFRVPSHTG